MFAFSIPFGEALEVRRSMFDVRVFFPFGEALDVRCSMFAFLPRSALRLVGWRHCCLSCRCLRGGACSIEC